MSSDGAVASADPQEGVEGPNGNGLANLFPERLVAENLSEAVWLRFRRLTSPTLCRRVIEARAPSLDPATTEQKGREVASSMRGALGYWHTQPTSLNAKVLSRYYALLQLSIAEQIADPTSSADLGVIQSHTESGHGLWSISAAEGEFPANYHIGCQKRGHFFKYCEYKGIDLTAYSQGGRPESWLKLTEERRGKTVSLANLFRRIPELQSLIEDTLGVPPMSFHIGHSNHNLQIQSQRRQQHTRNTGQVVLDPPPDPGPVTTIIAIYPQGQKLSVEYLNSLNMPLKNIRAEKELGLHKHDVFVGDLEHSPDAFWFNNLRTYKSGYCGTSYVVPFWGTDDIFILHFVTLYALGIIVRYLPSLWHEIEDGRLDHIRALIEQYLAVVDNVLPVVAIQRITGRKLIPVQPGSLQGPT